MLDLLALAQQCAPNVHPLTMAAILRVESGLNPFAIGVVGAHLHRQPQNYNEAVVTAKALESAGYNFSLGIAQVNRHNLSKYGLDYQRAFDTCANLHAASLILMDCYQRAKVIRPNQQDVLRAAFSCYFSGNFSTGFQPHDRSQTSYVQKVIDSAAPLDAAKRVQARHVMPALNPQASTRVPPCSVVRLTAVAPRHKSVMPNQHQSTGDTVMVYR